jgi:ClpP class serine protease
LRGVRQNRVSARALVTENASKESLRKKMGNKDEDGADPFDGLKPEERETMRRLKDENINRLYAALAKGRRTARDAKQKKERGAARQEESKP